VVLLETPENAPLAVYFNYPMHVAIGGPKFSSDYPGMVSRLVAGALGSDVLTVFSSGAAGNINHWDVGIADPQTGPREVVRVGTVLAAEIFKVLRVLKPAEAAPLRVKAETIQLPVAEAQPGELERARAVMAAARKGAGVAFLDLVHTFQVVGTADYDGFIPAEVQVVSIGDQVAWVGLPGEIFVELGMAIKQASPFPVTIVSELTNDDIKNSYVPNRKAYREGGYEVVTAICAEGAGEMLVDAAIRLLLSAHEGLPGTALKSGPSR
jgi:neutral ceramidase